MQQKMKKPPYVTLTDKEWKRLLAWFEKRKTYIVVQRLRAVLNRPKHNAAIKHLTKVGTSQLN